MLRIQLLGTVEAWADHEPVPLSGLKQRLILAHLALAHGRAVSVGTLFEDLWTDPPNRPLHAIHAHVSRLRAVLPVPILHSAAGYRLETGSRATDVDAFHGHLADSRSAAEAGDFSTAIDRLEEGLTLWRGSALAGLDEVIGLRPEIVRLTQHHATAIADRHDLFLRAHRAQEILADLQALVESDPLNERHAAQVMTALALTGDQQAALSMFTRVRDRVIEHVGTEIGTRLRDVQMAILQERDPRDALFDEDVPSSTRTSASGVAGEARKPAARSGLFGRDHDLNQLRQSWERSRDGLVLTAITGDAGIGKSRLAGEFLDRLTAHGATVLASGNEESLEVALQPFVDMMRRDTRTRTGGDLARRLGPLAADLIPLLPDLATTLAGDATPRTSSNLDVERLHLFDAIASWLGVVAAESPLCVFIDDVHWADPETLLLLRHLVKNHADLPIMFLVAFRDREERHGDARLDSLMRQSDAVVHLPLTGLDNDQSATLLDEELARVGGHAAADDFAARVRAASGGNPLFIVELARHLGRQSPGSSATTLEAETLPDGLRALIHTRLEHFDGPGRELLNHAAVIGGEFSLWLLQQSTGAKDTAIDDMLAAASFARLLEPTGQGELRFRFCHDAVRQKLMGSLGPLRRAAAHLKIAEALESSAELDPSERWHHLGHHHAEAAVAGTSAKAAHYLQLAGRLSMDQRAPQMAVEHFRRAWELLDSDAPDEVVIDLLLDLGLAQFHSGTAGYRETFLWAARAALKRGDHDRLIRAAAANNRGWYSTTAGIDLERVMYVESALRVCPPDNLRSRAELLQTWALENVREPLNRQPALEHSAEALAIAQELGDDAFLGHQMADAFSVRFASFSDPRELLTFAHQLTELADRVEDPALHLSASIGLAQIALMNADHPTAEQALARSERLAEHLNQPARLWLVRCWQAARIASRGDLAAAETAAEQAYELGAQCEPDDAETWFFGQIFMLHHHGGRLAEIIDAVEDRVGSLAATIPGWRAAHALALVSAGRDAEATAILDGFLHTERHLLPRDMLWLPAMSLLAEVAFRLNNVEAAQILHDRLHDHSGLMASNGTIDAGPVDLHIAGLAHTLGDRAWAIKHVDAAAEVSRRADAHLWLARAEAMRTVIESPRVP